jgi:hypothetical protein
MDIQLKKIVSLMDLNFLSQIPIIINAEYSLNSFPVKLKCSDFSHVFSKFHNVNKERSGLSFSSISKLILFTLYKFLMDHITIMNCFKMSHLISKNGKKWDKKLVKVSSNMS